jgi:DNA repair photolyase
MPEKPMSEERLSGIERRVSIARRLREAGTEVGLYVDDVDPLLTEVRRLRQQVEQLQGALDKAAAMTVQWQVPQYRRQQMIAHVNNALRSEST